MKIRAAVAVVIAALALAQPASAITYPDRGNVTPTQAPWVVSMWSVDSNYDRDSFYCTGSLIDAYTVLIAAHCITALETGQDFVLVRKQDSKSSRGEVLLPRSVVTHPEALLNGEIVNDIALIDLYYPASTTQFLQIPSAAKSNDLMKGRPVLYGWGMREEGEESDYLRKAALRSMTTQARTAYEELFNARLMLAAGRVNTDGTFTGACSGDSGGPLVGSVGTSQYVLGVVSFGEDTECESSAPTVFTRVASYLVWIKSARTTLKTTRAEKQISVAGAHFINSSTSPIKAVTGKVGSQKYRLYDANFVTELMGQAQSDIKSVRVTAYQHIANSWDVDFTIKSKSPWPSAACGLGAAYASSEDFITEDIPGQISVVLRSRSSWTSQVRITYSAIQDTCIPEDGLMLEPESLTNAPVPANCAAAIYANTDGSLSFAVTRECLPNPRITLYRIIMSSYGATDNEPGFDLWAGPFDLSSPN